MDKSYTYGGYIMAIVSETRIIKVLQAYNPWWRNPEAIRPLSRPRKRMAYYYAIKTLEHPGIRRFVVLSGPRRVGKTTVLYQTIEYLIKKGVAAGNILYISFDNPIVKMVSIDDIFNTYKALYPEDGDKYLLFDEVQYAENWELWIKVIYDAQADVKLMATGSASPTLEAGAADSGVGRWNILRIPTMSFYEYCDLLELGDRPDIPGGLRLPELIHMPKSGLADLMNRFAPLQRHFNRYLMIGGFPELALSNDDTYAQRMLREDVVDKVLKRDILVLFNIRNPVSMEKLFLYLCMTSSEIFNKQTTAKELGNISVSTIEEYIAFLEKSNLIYISNPMMVGNKAALKGKPKIYIADAAIRSAVLMQDDVLADEAEMGVIAETTVYKHIVSYYQADQSAQIGYYRKVRDNQKEVDIVIKLPKGLILCEVKYRNNSSIPVSDAIIELSKAGADVTQSFIITKNLMDYGLSQHNTLAPVLRVPALAFVYLLGMAEAR